MIREGPDGFTLHPPRIDLSMLAPLKDKIGPNPKPFDLEKVREEPYDPSLQNNTSILMRLLTGEHVKTSHVA